MFLIILKSFLPEALQNSGFLAVHLFAIRRYIITFADHFGLVAQLNRAPDYGSGGFRFES